MVVRSPPVGPFKFVLVYALHSLEKRPRPWSISGVYAKIFIIILNIFNFDPFSVSKAQNNILECKENNLNNGF